MYRIKNRKESFAIFIMENDSFQTSLWTVDENLPFQWGLFMNQSPKDPIGVVAADHENLYNKKYLPNIILCGKLWRHYLKVFFPSVEKHKIIFCL